MTRRELKNKYFNWIYSLVCCSEYTGGHSYKRLLEKLYDEEFTYVIGLDGNRAEDGFDLRYRFGDECDISSAAIAAYLDDRSCSVLEMMTALSLRCEESIMSDPELGSRIGRWFWGMIKSLGLYSMTDQCFDEKAVDDTLNRFLNRSYEPNGKGGLFTVKNYRRDMRLTEIWCQMMWYLDEITETKGAVL
ncbi:MAG: hypothetical protein NC120_13075 [Ruminococcus sp.]|nr:hypothetical protein [Ruminococcus sp.]